MLKNLRVCGKSKGCTRQLTSILKRLTITRLQACCSRIVVLKIRNSSPRLGVDRQLLYGVYFYHELDSFRDVNFRPPISDGREPLSSLHCRNSGAGNGRDGVYLVVIGVLCPPRVDVRCFPIQLWRKIQRQTICSDSIQFRNAKYLLRKARTSGANVSNHLFFVYFFHSPFLCWHIPYIFIGAAYDLPIRFFYFCNTCLFVTFRTSFGVAGPNIILLYSNMASKSVRYNIT